MKTIRKVALSLGLLGICTSLAGCAIEAIPYPKLSTMKTLKEKVLSREEQQEAIKGLTAEQEQHQKTAIKEIEKPQ